MDSEDMIDNKAFMNAFRQKNKMQASPDEKDQETSPPSERKLDRASTLSNQGSLVSPFDSKKTSPKSEIEKSGSFQYQRTGSLVASTVASEGNSSLLRQGPRNFGASLIESSDYDFAKDPIFTRLCKKTEFKDTDNCIVCKSKFNMLLKKRRHCKFCGSSICDEHGKKRRPDPEASGNYVRICDHCDRKYINKMIQDEFKAKLENKERDLKELEARVTKYQEIYKTKQNNYDNQLSEKNRKDKEYNNRITQLIEKTSDIKDEIKRIEKENAALNQKYTDISKESEELDKKIASLKSQDEQQYKENQELISKIKAIDQDIVQINKTLEEYENNMTINKMVRIENKNKDTSYITRADVMGVTNSSLLSQGFTESRIQDGPYKSRIGAQTQGNPNYERNQKADPGMCNTKCNIF